MDRQFLLGPALLVSPVLEPVCLLPAMSCCSTLTGGLQEEAAGVGGGGLDEGAGVGGGGSR